VPLASKIELRRGNHGDREDRIDRVKQAILATVVEVKRKCPDSVVVLLESDELSKATEIVSTGLDCQQSYKNAKSGLEVTCKGDPRAETGDKVPVVVNSETKS
jgi:hypothetical protein